MLGCLQHFRRVTGPEFSLKAGTASPHRKYLHMQKKCGIL